MAQPSRERIVQLIWEHERSAGDIAAQLPVSFAAVSQHLAKLLDAGVITVRQDGRHRFYRARREAFGTLAIYLEAMWSDRLTDLKRIAERELQKGKDGS